jgi:hypothetical protein
MSLATQNQNQFKQNPVIGQVAYQANVDTQTAVINPSTAAAAGSIVAGCAVKLIAGASPEILVDVTTGPSDGPVFGVIGYNPRKNTYGANDHVEILTNQDVVFLYSSAAINRGARVSVTNPSTSAASPTVATDTTAGDYTLGYAEGQSSAANQFIKIKIAPAVNLVPSTTSTATSVVSP